MGARQTQHGAGGVNKLAVLPQSKHLISMSEFVSDMGFYDIKDEAESLKDVERQVNVLKAKKKSH